MSIPSAFKAVTPWIRHASALKNQHPVIAYYCNLYALNEALEIRKKVNSDKEATMWLTALLQECENANQQLGDQVSKENGKDQVERFALVIWVNADDEDRRGEAKASTAKNFFSAAQFFQVLSEFGPIEPVIQEKIKWAKHRAVEIQKALKEGRQPQPPPPSGNEEKELEDLESELNQLKTPRVSEFPTVPSFSSPSNNTQQTPSFPDIPTPSFDTNPTQQNKKPPVGAKPTPFTQGGSSSTPSFPPTPSSAPSFPSTPSSVPSSNAKPAASQPPTPTPSFQTNTYVPPTPDYKPSPADVERALKVSKFVTNSLNYEDIPAAIKFSKEVLTLLTGQQFQ